MSMDIGQSLSLCQGEKMDQGKRIYILMSAKER